MPVERLAALGREYGIPILVDCAQSAGVLPIDLLDSGIDYLCMPGHKGLYGPMGTGVLITSKGEQLQTIIEGGTGTFSESYEQPKDMPERLGKRHAKPVRNCRLTGWGCNLSVIREPPGFSSMKCS